MNRWKIAAGAAALALVMSPFAWGVAQTEAKLSKRFEKIGEDFPSRTTELMGFFSVESGESECHGTAAKQLGTELSPIQVAEHVLKTSRAGAEISVGWFEKQRVVVLEPGAERARTLEEGELEALPMAARFLLNVHAFLPEGVRRVVLFSSEKVEGPWEPRCW